MPDHLSYSQIHQLRTCGESYRLSRVEGWPKRPSVPAVAGQIVHTATEAVDKVFDDALVDYGAEGAKLVLDLFGNNAAREAAETAIPEACNDEFPTVDTWKRFGRKTVEKPNAEDMQWFLDVGIPNAVAAYVNWRLAHPELTLDTIPGFGPAIEVPFAYQLNGQLIVGFIDRVFQHNGEGHYPVDLKSGLKPKTDEQLGLYARALHSALGWEPTYGFFVYGLKKGEAQMTPPLSLAHWTEQKLDRVYLGAKVQIESGIFIPSPGENCYVCDVAWTCDFAQAVI